MKTAKQKREERFLSKVHLWAQKHVDYHKYKADQWRKVLISFGMTQDEINLLESGQAIDKTL